MMKYLKAEAEIIEFDNGDIVTYSCPKPDCYFVTDNIGKFRLHLIREGLEDLFKEIFGGDTRSLDDGANSGSTDSAGGWGI